MKRYIYLAVIAVAGCAMVDEVKGPDGRTAYVINCGMHDQYCWEKAGELCPSGYDIVSKNTAGVYQHSYMTVSCKEAKKAK